MQRKGFEPLGFFSKVGNDSNKNMSENCISVCPTLFMYYEKLASSNN